MLEVSDAAVKHFQEVGETTPTTPVIRIAIMGSRGTSCGLGLIMDQIQETDIAIENGPHTIVVDKKLMEYCRKITIDFTNGEPNRCDSLSKRGFLINAENPVNF